MDTEPALKKDAAGFGLKVVEGQRSAEDDYYLWPECEVTWNLWQRVQTQWNRPGFSGLPEGLNYSGVDVVIRHSQLKKKHWPEQFALLQEMESAALDAWRD